MAKGGARARSGPAPDPNALRRDRDAGEWTTLPGEGRKGRAPAWPLFPKANRRESVMWQRFWKKPQALMWERDQQHELVALYVRRFCEAEARESAVNLSTLIKQLGEDLGLTNSGLARNKWRIASDQVGARRDQRQTAAAPRLSSRQRLKAVSGGGS